MYILFVVRYMRIVYKLAPFFFMGRNADGSVGGGVAKRPGRTGLGAKRHGFVETTRVLRSFYVI